MMQIKIADTQFAHGTSLGSGDLKIYPKHFQWYRGTDNINDMVVITESMFHQYDSFNEKIKIAWLLEPISISPESYDTIIAKWWKFDYILTHNNDFLKVLNKAKELWPHDSRILLKDTKFCWYPFGGCWIMPEDRKMIPKTKGISIIASGKNETEGHKLRHEVIKALGDKVDVYGRGYNPIEYKIDALKDYQYSIVIENEKTEGFFTEKLIDCCMTGTIPIYWGCPDIEQLLAQPRYMPPGHIDRFNTVEELINIVDEKINQLSGGKTEDDVYLLAQQAGYNYTMAQQFTCPEDWLYNNFFMKEGLLKSQLMKFNIL